MPGAIRRQVERGLSTVGYVDLFELFGPLEDWVSATAKERVDAAYRAAKELEERWPDVTANVYAVKVRLEDGTEDGSGKYRISYVRGEVAKRSPQLAELLAALDSAFLALEEMEVHGGKGKATTS
jgi:multidrug resistance efflux pump